MEEKTTGWTCPSCKNIYAPGVKECKRCNERIKKEQAENPTKVLLNEGN